MPQFTVVGTWDTGEPFAAYLVARDDVQVVEIVNATVRAGGLHCVILPGHLTILEEVFPKTPSAFFDAALATTKIPMPPYKREEDQLSWYMRDQQIKAYLTWYRSQT